MHQYPCIVASTLARRGSYQCRHFAGDEETGVTIMKMDVGLDTGPMLAKKKSASDETIQLVLFFKHYPHWERIFSSKPCPIIWLARSTAIPQPEEGSTYAPMLKKQDGLLDFTRPAI
jgi:methionyl-tRNA formyltransferase